MGSALPPSGYVVDSGDHRVAHAMHPARYGLPQGQAVLNSSISPVALEAVARILVRQHPHRTVPQDLRHHARRRNRGALTVRPWQTLDLGHKLKVPIREAAPGVGA